VSYILDALRKVAKQRDRQAPMLQRLLSPAPAPRSAWARSPGRLLAALLLNAILLSALLVIWLRPAPVAAPPSPPAAPVADVQVGKTARGERDAVVTPAAVVAEPKRTAVEPPPIKPNRLSGTAPPPRSAAPAVPRRPAPTARGVPEPAKTPPAAPPGPPAAPAPAEVRIEALIYSDAPERRMIFVGGRKYVEGDTIDGRLRVEEIREDGVELSEQGRRFTVRVAR